MHGNWFGKWLKGQLFLFLFFGIFQKCLWAHNALIMEKNNKNHRCIIWLIIPINAVLPIIDPYYSCWQQWSERLRVSPIDTLAFPSLASSYQAYLPIQMSLLVWAEGQWHTTLRRTWPGLLSPCFCCSNSSSQCGSPFSGSQCQKPLPKYQILMSHLKQISPLLRVSVSTFP